MKPGGKPALAAPVNPAFGCLVGFVAIVLFIVAFIVFFLIFKKAWEEFTDDNGNFVGPACTTQVSGSVPDISSRPCCCSSGNLVSIAKYVSEVNLVAIPDEATAPLAVCSQYCDNFTPNQPCTGVDSNQFTPCMNALNPTSCSGVAKPVAFNNGVPYYGIQIGPCTGKTWDCLDITQCE